MKLPFSYGYDISGMIHHSWDDPPTGEQREAGPNSEHPAAAFSLGFALPWWTADAAEKLHLVGAPNGRLSRKSSYSNI